MSLLRQQRRIFCFFGRTVPDNRRACSALTGIGENFLNKQNVIFSKMTLLATTSFTIEKKISKQGFRMSKFRMPVNAATLRMVMLMN